MPAITVDDLTVLDRLRDARAGRPAATRVADQHRTAGLRGGGVPGAPRVRRHRPPAARPVHHDGPDGRGGLRARARPRARRGTRTAASRPSPTSSTASSTTRTRHGGGGTITNGDTQWMTAGSGLLHIEAPPEWLVAEGRPLPRHPALGEPAPRRQDERPEVPGHPLRRGRARHVRRRAARWCASSPATVDGHAGPGSTFTPMSLVHATIEPGARLELPWDVDFNALVYVLNGSGTVGTDGQPDPHRPGGASSARATS